MWNGGGGYPGHYPNSGRDPSDNGNPTGMSAPPYAAAAAAAAPQNDDSDAEEQQPSGFHQHRQQVALMPAYHHPETAPQPHPMDEEEEDDRKPPARNSPPSDASAGGEEPPTAMEMDSPQVIKPVIRPNAQFGGKEPRGKPEAMAIALAASGLSEKQKELQAQQAVEVEVVAEPVEATVEEEPPAASPKKPAKSPTKRKTTPTKKSQPRKKAAPRKPKVERSEQLLNETVPPISPEEYENLQALMIQFCRVPLLAEFSRPVMLLHPELVSMYSKIVTHPVDLGHVCRGIRRKQYKSLRDVRLDMWRVFANCVKFHSHPHNKEAVPSFVSIALHLREYFNNLWQEYMMPSDPPVLEEGAATAEVTRKAFLKRQEERRKRFDNIAVVHMNQSFMNRIATWMEPFIESGGIVDKLDKEPVFGPRAPVQDRDLDLVVENLKKVQADLRTLSTDTAGEPELVFNQFTANIKACYSGDILEDNASLRMRVRNRVDRFVEKILVPICEANSRGVTQSSIWGNLAAVIWARESSKKPFWPALCLGMLSPPEQREGWHAAITNRNESRLPDKLRTQLLPAKRKCEMAQKRNPLSYFLVEFLGTHEFIWVRETDIVEGFDPASDPNKNVPSSFKKKRASRSNDMSRVVGSKTYATAVEEGVWASEEFEGTLEQAFEENGDKKEGEDGSEEDDDEEMNYSYVVLAQSDDEADDEDDHGYLYEVADMSDTDVDEANYLIAHDGKIEIGPDGKSTISKKKKTPTPRKKGHDSKSKADSSPKSKASPAKKKKDSKAKEREEKKEQRELEKRRRKRVREREKALRSAARKKKRQRTSSEDEDDERGLQHDKRARATAIVKAYLARTIAEDPSYTNLGLAGVMTIPSVLVDSTGLLGMALAFRSAAGELPMPDETDEAKTEPWKAIDAETPKTSAERTANLEKQMELVEKEIERVQANAERRKQMSDEYTAQFAFLQNDIAADEEAARRNHYKKKKKAPPPKVTDRSPEESAAHKVESPVEAAAGETVSTEVDEAGPSMNEPVGSSSPAEDQAENTDEVVSPVEGERKDSPSDSSPAGGDSLAEAALAEEGKEELVDTEMAEDSHAF